jgi:hypothetical protein
MKSANATKFNRKSGVVEGPALSLLARQRRWFLRSEAGAATYLVLIYAAEPVARLAKIPVPGLNGSVVTRGAGATSNKCCCCINRYNTLPPQSPAFGYTGESTQ